MNINGILILNKPVFLSSNIILEKIKNLFKIKKAGHCGSLDPFASGVLPIFIGKKTKFSKFFLNSNKIYIALVKFGYETDSNDSTGKIIHNFNISIYDYWYKVKNFYFNKFIGNYSQIPSIYSAIKYKGQSFYKMINFEGKIKINSRKVVIYDLNFFCVGKNLFLFIISCGKGTYIRSFIKDIGKDFGLNANLISLCRMSCGKYSINDSISFCKLKFLFDLNDKNIFKKF